MSDSTEYVPPKVWTWENQSGGKFTNINRPIAGATHEKELPVGKHPLQLYSLGTPNGVKVTVLLEELLALGHEGAEYDAFLINIGDGDQFLSVSRFIPDFKNQVGNVDITVKSRSYPASSQTTHGPYEVSTSTTKQDTRIRGRQLALRVSSDATDDDWRYGTMRFDGKPDGMRG